MKYVLVRRRSEVLDLETFADGAGLHPELVRRLVALGLLAAERGAAGELWFAPDELARAARIHRLRAGLSLNYAAIGLVMDLLDRIDELNAALRGSSRSWTWTASATETDATTDRTWIGG